MELLTSRSKLIQRGRATVSDFLSSKFFQLTVYSWVQWDILSSGLTRLPTKLIQPAVGILRRLVSWRMGEALCSWILIFTMPIRGMLRGRRVL